MNNVLKKYLPLQRFNEQINKSQNDKDIKGNKISENKQINRSINIVQNINEQEK